MDIPFFLVVDGGWLLEHGKNPDYLAARGLCAIGPSVGGFVAGCSLLVRFRDRDGAVVADESGRLETHGGVFHIRSERLASALSLGALRGRFAVFLFEGTSDEGRCVVQIWERSKLAALGDVERLIMFGMPPDATVVVDAEHLVSAMYGLAAEEDSALLSVDVDRFLQAPTIIAALFAHLESIPAEDNLRFPFHVKTIAEQLRGMLLARSEGPRILRVEKSHLDLWAEVETRRFAFLDGGAARITALPGLSPTALRVGIYSVLPGVPPDEGREWFGMRPFVVGDLLDSERPTDERPDRRRLQEAARYTLEPLSGLLHLREFPSTEALFLHGPLVNQFAQYDEGEPNFIPFLAPRFLSTADIDREAVLRSVRGIPADRAGVSMWNHFMAVYSYVMRAVDESPTPIAGVVERPTGRAVTRAVLVALESEGNFTAAYRRKVEALLDRYDITDDFLFGCMLREGEYLTPVRIQKNARSRARPRWGPVVAQYPHPSTMLLKSEETNFPFRVELNQAGAARYEFLARFLYHTARLLPRYAFPVGLDIADKYAKIPDWLSRGVSAELSAKVLQRAMRLGDPRLVAALRLFLARGPRDFFYRPNP